MFSCGRSNRNGVCQLRVDLWVFNDFLSFLLCFYLNLLKEGTNKFTHELGKMGLKFLFGKLVEGFQIHFLDYWDFVTENRCTSHNKL